jgi:hypothetical protein
LCFVVISDVEHDLAQARHALTLRTDRTTVSFLHPFTLRELEGVQPAGDYIVDTDNEVIEGLSRIVYRRVATLLTIPRVSASQALSERVAVDQTELDAALMKDRPPHPEE